MTEYQAGQALDQLIAEKVMGWTIREMPCPWNEYCKEGQPVRGYSHWAPSTNIEHAFEVVERMKGLCDGEISMGLNGGDRWVVKFYPDIEVNASLPLAICIAALKRGQRSTP